MSIKQEALRYKWEDYKKDFIPLLGQALTLIATDKQSDFEKCIDELILLTASYRYMKDHNEGSKEDDKTNHITIQDDGQEDEEIITGQELSVILNNEIRKEADLSINLNEIPTFIFKVYNSEKYSIPAEQIFGKSRIDIPSDDGYEYYLPVTVADNNVLYVEMGIFEKEYPYLKAAYIRKYRENTENSVCKISEMLDKIVDVTLLETETKIAKWINNRIEYSQRPKTEEQKKLEGNKQSMIDNQNIRFLYGENDDVYHDKSCSRVKLISLKELRGRENPPSGKLPCKECIMDMFIRKGCVDDFKNVGLYKFFFHRGNVDVDLLKAFLAGPNAGFRIESANKLRMTYGEDAWKIETDGRGNFIKLWHNNYIVDKKGKRHISKGEYHEQITETVVSVETAVHYIMDYNFNEKHRIA